MNIKDTIGFIGERMTEASSWGGTAIIVLSALHVNANPTLINAILGAVAAIGGVIAILVPEGKPNA